MIESLCHVGPARASRNCNCKQRVSPSSAQATICRLVHLGSAVTYCSTYHSVMSNSDAAASVTAMGAVTKTSAILLKPGRA